jgi:phenylacetate-CoA ligase
MRAARHGYFAHSCTREMTERLRSPDTWREGLGHTPAAALPSAFSSMLAFRRHLRGSRAEIVAFQNRRLRRIITHAYARVPYYRRLFDQAGVSPRHIRTVSDLDRIPVTSKSDLREVPLDQLLAKGVNPSTLIEHSTGGSTGEPFTVRRSWIEERILGDLRRRTLRLYGASSGSLVVVATFHHRPHRNDNRFLELVLNVFGRYRVQSIFCLESPESILRQFEALRPDVIGGYAGVLSRLARVITESGRPFRTPQFILSGGEVLTPGTAHRISAAFGAPVHDTYGAHEFSRIAWSCPVTGDYHCCDDGLIAEVLKDGRVAAGNEEGELVGTALHSYVMPFIRYRLSDVVTKGREACSCGQPFSTLRRIQGRVVDYFTLPTGALLHPYEIAAALKDWGMAWVGQYQLIQESLTRVVLKAVPLREPSADDLSAMKARAQAVVGDGVSFGIDVVDEIQLEEQGKFRVYRSLVPG